MNRKPFSPSEEEFLRDNHLKLSSPKLAAALGCSRSKVLNFFKRNNMKMPKEVKARFRSEALKGRTSFTPEMDKFLLENYLTMPVKTLGKKIGKSGTGVNVRMRQLGLVIPKKIREARKKIGRFNPGMESWNKNKSQKDWMSPEAIAKTAKTRFKKGQKPHNTAFKNGCISLRKDTDTGITYQYIRVSLGKWELYNRYLWEKHRGPIPEGHVIRFKDGNTMNCHLDNLECLDQAENLQRNWHQYPIELKRAIKLTNKINKQL